ncbi:hypothetical protein Ae717Ps2_7016c [Pseudonocardia sp. Ae717_Ps2]|nr:hypothetical protein Ae717Ps2_7016c [Pseudonocardia sp. Ae717_Ps2]
MTPDCHLSLQQTRTSPASTSTSSLNATGYTYCCAPCEDADHAEVMASRPRLGSEQSRGHPM